MSTFTRISDSEARCVMTNRSYGLLRVTPDSDEWILTPRLTAADTPTPGRLPWYFIRRQAGAIGYCVHRAGGERPLVGYAEGLSDAAWPADRDIAAHDPSRLTAR